MRSTLLDLASADHYELAFEPGERVISDLRAFANARGIAHASFVAIGAVSRAELAVFNPVTERFDLLPVHRGHAEMLSLAGQLSTEPGAGLQVHGHAVLCRPDGSVFGGHLIEAVVGPMLVLTLEQSLTPLTPSCPATLSATAPQHLAGPS